MTDPENDVSSSKRLPTPPRVVVVVSDKEYRRLTNDEARAWLLDAPDFVVVPYSMKPLPQTDRVSALREELEERDLLVIDQLLIRNPYNTSAYEAAEDAIEAFVKAKYYHVAAIAACLGAESISFVKVRIDQADTQTNQRLRGDVAVAQLDQEFERSVTRRFEDRFEASTALRGNEPDVDAALSLMRKRRLSNDPDVAGLIELCSTPNAVRKHTVKFNGVRESQRSLKVGLELTTQLDIEVAGGALFIRAVKSIDSIEVTTEIVWPNT